MERNGEVVVQAAVRDITEQKRAEKEVGETLLWQQGVNLLQQSLLAPARLEDKLKAITDSVVGLFDADFCRIWLIRPGDLCERGCIHAEVTEGPHVCRYRSKCLHLLASSGRYTRTDGKVHGRVPFDCYKIGRIASGEDHKLLTNDVQNDPCVHNHQWARELGLVSFAGYQLRVPDGETLGVLALFSKHPIRPTEDAILDELSTTTAFVVQQAAAEEGLEATQMQLIDAAKMKSVGQLAAGVAHEVKNPLATALMGLEYLSSTVAINDEQAATALKDTKEALLQADSIIRELLSFSVPAKLDLKLQDLNAIVEHSLHLVRHEAWNRHVTLTMELEPNLPHLGLDKNKMEQTLVNLFMNAIDAMLEGGTLLVKTRANRPKTGATDVIAEVEDTGHGIAEGDLEKIFDPFFTKKQKGKGIGLGLTVARRIVHMHGGTLRISNRPEGGVNATITLRA
jgi:signal transduction histidine kinase